MLECDWYTKYFCIIVYNQSSLYCICFIPLCYRAGLKKNTKQFKHHSTSGTVLGYMFRFLRNRHKTIHKKTFKTHHSLTWRTDVNQIFSMNCIIMIPHESKLVVMQVAIYCIEFCLTELFVLLFYSLCCWL